MVAQDSALYSQPLVEQVYVRLRTEIREGRLAPGTLHSVSEVAAELGVSRTPVREAVLQLARSGLVALHRNRGFAVTVLEPADIVQIFQVRMALECSAIAQVALTPQPSTLRMMRAHWEAMRAAAEADDQAAFMAADRDFHAAALAGCGNPRLAAMVDQVRDSVFSRGVSTSGGERTWCDLVVEHRQILEAVEAQDPAGAARAMSEHLRQTGNALISLAGGGEDPDWAAAYRRG